MAGYQATATRFDDTEGLAGLIEGERRQIQGPVEGEVISYDAKRQKATIRPKLKQDFDGTVLQAPDLLEVPIQVQRFGGAVIHSPLKAGDRVMLQPTGRSMDSAWDGDDDSDGHPGRMSDLSDCFAVPMSGSKTKELPNLPSDRMHIGTEDGQSGLQVKPDGTFDLVKGGDSILKLIVDALTAYRDHKHGGVPMDPPDIEKANQLIQRAEAMKA